MSDSGIENYLGIKKLEIIGIYWNLHNLVLNNYEVVFDLVNVFKWNWDIFMEILNARKEKIQTIKILNCRELWKVKLLTRLRHSVKIRIFLIFQNFKHWFFYIKIGKKFKFAMYSV